MEKTLQATSEADLKQSLIGDAILFSPGEAAELLSLYKRFVSLYRTVKSHVIASEKCDREGRLSLPAINEFRNALDHDMRVRGVTILRDLSGPDRADIAPFEYCKQNISKAIGHIYRAGYDALDVISFSLLDEIGRLCDSVSQTTLVAVIPGYGSVIRSRLQDATKMCNAAKANKDVESDNVAEQHFRSYEQAIETLSEVKHTLEEHLPELRRVDAESSQAYLRQRNWTIGIGLASIVISILLTWLFTKG